MLTSLRCSERIRGRANALGSLLTKQQWTGIGAIASLLGTLIAGLGWAKGCTPDPVVVEEEPAPFTDAELSKTAVIRLRLAAADGVISAPERASFEQWVESHAEARERLRNVRHEVESELVAAARAGIESVKDLKKGRYQSAIEGLKRALRHDAENLDAQINLGAAHLASGQFEMASGILREALEQVGQGQRFLADVAKNSNGRARTLLVEAEQVALMTQALRRAEFQVRYNLAGCLAEQGSTRAAGKHLEGAAGCFERGGVPGFTADRFCRGLDADPNLRSIDESVKGPIRRRLCSSARSGAPR